ncbi:MAG: phage shock protein PspA [Vibrionaceae bacterium]
MGIFSRFSDIISANVNALLDKAEDPEKMVRLIIQEMEDTLVEVRTSSARVLADKKELSRKIGHYASQQHDWQQKASLALQKGREDLARAALLEKQKVAELLARLQNELHVVEENINKLSSEIGALEAKLLETRARQQTMIMRRQAASNRVSVQQQLNNTGTEQALAKLDQYERKIDELEAQADSYLMGQHINLKSEFANLQAQDEIEQELARMKQNLKQANKSDQGNF